LTLELPRENRLPRQATGYVPRAEHPLLKKMEDEQGGDAAAAAGGDEGGGSPTASA